MTKTSRINTAQAHKVRRQKQTAAILGALLLVLLVVQGPKTLKKLHGQSAAPATPAATAAPATAGSGAAPASSTAAAVAATPAGVASSASLADSDVAPARTKSQLLSFEHFKSKDPFVQQVSEETAPAATPTGSSATAGTSSTTAGAAPSAAAGTGGASVATSSYSTATAVTPKARRVSGNLAAALLDVNGSRESVAVEQTFPKANPTFKLVSLGNGVAMIGLAGGTYASGAQTVALRLGRTLTLVNTADGMRYELRLVSAP